MTEAPVLPGWRHVATGKVRDIYAPEDRSADAVLLLVASDRVSAFDVVLEPAIPNKGAILTELTNWWFTQLPHVPNHRTVGGPEVPDSVADRATLVKRLKMLPVECVVRGYLTGSGLREYRETGAVCGVRLPAGLADGDRLPEPIFTPAYKAPYGEHDENITFDRTVELIGGQAAEAVRATSLDIFRIADAITAKRGVLLADTKFEFGDDLVTGVITLGDEVLTSDSSRYWDASAYAEGRRGVSWDKQIVRDWLSANWDRTGTPPILPDEVVQATATRYRELLVRLTS